LVSPSVGFIGVLPFDARGTAAGIAVFLLTLRV